jgi:hypothetical protein
MYNQFSGFDVEMNLFVIYICLMIYLMAVGWPVFVMVPRAQTMKLSRAFPMVNRCVFVIRLYYRNHGHGR